jgi:gamma-D-glutamyl-L-lysine dipeptidyl-peptidase
MERVSRLKRLIDEIRGGYAPDPRVAVFEIEFEWDADSVVLFGATSRAEAAAALHREAALIDGWEEVRDEVERLPRGTPGQHIHAIASAAVVPLLAGPQISETHVSQVVLGRRLTILRRQGRWLQCRSEDGYLGWVHRGYVVEVEETDARAWEMGVGGEAWTSLGAEVRNGDGEVLVRLPWGARVVRRADGSVQLPDGTAGEVDGVLVPLQERPTRFPPRGEEIVQTAARWLGAPYLWGGVTRAGVDCSGFVQAVLHLHGISLPRDSDQQARTGEPIESDEQFSNLLPGDVLFFAETPRRISHVTLSLGGSRIIHSSLGNGSVRRNDLMGTLPYERNLRDLFVCARRYL